MSDVPLHTQFFFVAYDCVCEGWDAMELTTEDVYLHDRTAFQDVIRRSRQQTYWRSDGLRVSVLRIVGKLLHMLNGRAVYLAQMYGKAVHFAEVYGKAVTLLKCREIS